MRIAFLASHNGSAAKAIAQACRGRMLAATPALLISNNAGSSALQWAKEMGMETAIINAGNAANPDRAIADLMKEHSIDLALCSGYMKLIGADSIGALKGRILNIHPALLPLYGGKGMYGPRVHQAVHDNGDRETGITIHLVNNEYDRGRIIAQKRIPIPPASSATEIEEMVKAAEPDFYIETLAGILTGSITLA